MLAGQFPAQSPEGCVLNMALLDQYKSRKNNLLERLINAYLEEAPKSFQALRKAVASANFADIRMNAHALKSTSYNLGAMRLSQMCQAIETAAIGQDQAAITEQMAQIGPECFDVEQALCRELYLLKQPPAPHHPAPADLDDDWN